MKCNGILFSTISVLCHLNWIVLKLKNLFGKCQKKKGTSIIKKIQMRLWDLWNIYIGVFPLAVYYFCKKATSWIFNRVLNMPLKKLIILFKDWQTWKHQDNDVFRSCTLKSKIFINFFFEVLITCCRNSNWNTCFCFLYTAFYYF